VKGLVGKRKLLRIFISLGDSYQGKPLWEYILQMVKEKGLAGATVFKAAAGIGAHSELRTFTVWRLAQELPVVIEIIDTEEKISGFLNFLDQVIEEGLVVLEDVEVISYRHRER
jgi:PII-like signaling protein